MDYTISGADLSAVVRAGLSVPPGQLHNREDTLGSTQVMCNYKAHLSDHRGLLCDDEGKTST